MESDVVPNSCILVAGFNSWVGLRNRNAFVNVDGLSKKAVARPNLVEKGD